MQIEPDQYGQPGNEAPGSSERSTGEWGAGSTPPRRESRPPRLDPRLSRRKSPVLAALLSMMPGLGQVYVGHYQRGFIHFVIFAGTVSIVASGGTRSATPLFGLFIAFFWLYNLIDAIRLATFYNEALDGLDPAELRREMLLPSRGGSIPAGITLLVVGGLILLHRVAGLPLEWLRDWWPVAPIAFGAYLLVKGLQERRAP